MTQQSLLDELVREERPHKRQRQSAREIYRRKRDEDIVAAKQNEETREGMVLRCLAAHWNRYQESPTARELFAWMKARGERVDDINSVRPRLTKLVDELGLVEIAGKRVCRQSGEKVSTYRVREMGT